jgi:Uma2 family endonuclease
MAAQRVPFITPQEYLAGEKIATTKSEYISGEIFAMAGGSLEHTVISSDVQLALGIALRGGSCEVYNSDIKVRVEEGGPFFYPDVTIVCGEPQSDFDDCLRNPTVLVEVLSESTALFDRSEKFFHYRRFASLQHYILIDQYKVMVEHWEKRDDGLWALVGEHTDLTDSLYINGLRVSIPLSEIYRRVSFPASET